MCNLTMKGIVTYYRNTGSKFTEVVTTVMDVGTLQEINNISSDLNKQIHVKVWMDSLANKVMKEGVTTMFTQNQHLRQYLINTGDKKLVEANPHDIHWSCGLALKDVEKINDIEHWPGKNVLGNILMDARETLKASTN